MKYSLLTKKFLAVALVVTVAAGVLSARANKDELKNVSSVNYDQQWLKTYYDIQPFPESVLADAFNADLAAITGSSYADSTKWSVAEAIEASIKASTLNELALTYSETKAERRLIYYGIKGISGIDASYLACALDSGLISADAYKQAKNKVTGALAAELIMHIADINGKGPNPLGFTTDDDILGKIGSRFRTFALYQSDELDTIGAKLVIDKISTGYNLKKTADEARFLPSLTLKYGHSSEQHAKQLIALLNSEGIRARIQIEPKTSIYEYLLEWGTPAPSSATYRVEKYNDSLYLVYATEYDMEIEFRNEADLIRFNAVHGVYSKKNDENQAKGSTVKLIAGAWWQPLYSASFNPDPANYTQIADNVLYSTDGTYSLHSFSTVEKSSTLIQKMKELSGRDARPEIRYVNNAFYRYLTGTDHQ